MADRIDVAVVADAKARPLLRALWLFLLHDYPDHNMGERVTVEVYDTVLRKRCVVPVPDPATARRVRDRVRATAATMSDADLDEWSRTDRWRTFAD